MVSGANFNFFKVPEYGTNSQYTPQRVGGHNPAVEGEYGSKNTKAVGAKYNEYATNQDLFNKMEALDGRDRSPETRNAEQGQRLYCLG